MKSLLQSYSHNKIGDEKRCGSFRALPDRRFRDQIRPCVRQEDRAIKPERRSI